MKEEPLIQDEGIAKTWHSLLYACSRVQEKMIRELLDLKYDLERNTGHACIRSVASRLKSMESIEEKLQRLHLENSPESAKENLHDIIGLRLVCSYLSDIEIVLCSIGKNPHFQIVQVKDYISKPKSSGYRSMHVIVQTDYMGEKLRCEIQLRTTAMDGWAALEHQLRYKKGLHAAASVHEELHEISDMLFETDCRMQKVYTELADQKRKDLEKQSRKTASSLARTLPACTVCTSGLQDAGSTAEKEQNAFVSAPL
jgi:putative GTP pyrophosphokinase